MDPAKEPAERRGSRNPGLDGLRGFAALSVALGHSATVVGGLALWATSIRAFPGLSWTDIVIRLLAAVFPSDAAVMVFFVLSGHVLWESFRRKRSRLLSDLPDYVCARLFRLMPLTIVTALPLGLLTSASARELVMNMLLFSDSLNGVLWSLQVEVVASLGLFLLWGVTLGNVRAVLAALAVAVVATPFCRGNPYVVFLPAFILGALISSAPRGLWRRPLLLPAGITVLLLTNIVLGHGGVTRCFEIVGATVLVGAVAHGRLRFLDRRVPQFLGAVSYPFYLIHPIVMAAVEARVMPHVAVGPLFSVLILAVLSIGVAMPIAWLLHVGIEMPALQGRPKIRWGSEVA